jgi:hypothetical protein
MTPPDYLTVLFLRDGAETSLCRLPAVAAATVPGCRHVFVCGAAFRRQGVGARENTLIHEMLHSLGLGENPPSPDEIAGRIVRRCGN